MLPAFAQKIMQEQIEFEAAMLDLSILYDKETNDFTERFKGWLQNYPISWRRGVDILRSRYVVNAPLPWQPQVGPSEYK